VGRDCRPYGLLALRRDEMSKLTTILLALALAGCATDAERGISVEAMAPLVREYAFRDKPTLRSDTQFRIEEYELPGLWRDLRVQLFLARYMSPDGGQFNERLLIYHDGEVTPFASALGGHGLMSAVVMDGDLYYTYSDGSGRHWSHVGRLSIDGEEIRILESGGYLFVDLFVRSVDGRIQVEAGKFARFNSWKVERQVGWLKSEESSLAIVDATGAEIPLDSAQ